MLRKKSVNLVSLLLIVLMLGTGCNEKVRDRAPVSVRGHQQDLYSIHGISDRLLWAVGKLGTILYSPDGGESWELQTSGVKLSLFDVFFINEVRGFAVGQKGVILETKNGGETWEVKQRDEKYQLLSISSTSEFIYAIGDYGTVLRKGINDESWEDMSLGKDVILNSIQFINDKSGWICGEFGLLLKTDSGGEMWNRIESVPWRDGEGPYVFKIKFHNKNVGTCTLAGNKILLTRDGGSTWDAFERKRTYYGAVFNERKLIFTGEGGVELLDWGNEQWEYSEFFEKSPVIGLWLRDGYFGDTKAWFVGSAGNIYMLSTSKINKWEMVHPE